MLELRPNCEYCDKDLPPQSAEAMICTYECTFCRGCVEGPLSNVCPNCGGGFCPRPVRPQKEWRTGLSLDFQKPSLKRRYLSFTLGNISELVARAKDIPPDER